MGHRKGRPAGWQALADAALALHGRGLPITLNRPATKKPLGQGWSETANGKAWQQKRWEADEICCAYRRLGAVNPGLLLGPESGIIDIEGDAPSAEADFAKLFVGCEIPVTPTFVGRRGKHRLFALHPALAALDTAQIKCDGLEIRAGGGGKGCQSLMPPSVTDDLARVWLVDFDECDPADLPELVVQRILSAAGPNRRSGSTPKADENRHSRHKPLHVSAAPTVSTVSTVSQAAIEKAIGRTLPTGPGQRNRQLFEFARHLKAIPELAAADAGDLRHWVELWHAQALPAVTTKEFSESWFDFLNAWQAAIYPAGQGPIAMVYQDAIAAGPPAAAAKYQVRELRNLVSLCRQLQRVSGDEPFFLACRVAGELIGVPHQLANSWLRLLVRDNVLEVVTHGTRHKASEYRYPEP